jgi:hypothetical protein
VIAVDDFLSQIQSDELIPAEYDEAFPPATDAEMDKMFLHYDKLFA